MAGRLLEDFAELASDWFWEMDETYRFSYFSGSLEQATGVSPQQEIGKSRVEISANAEIEAFWQPHVDDLLNRRTFRNFVYPYKRKDGQVRWFSTSGQPVFDDAGAFKGYRGVGSDITAERNARDQLSEALEALRATNARLAEQNRLFETAIDNISQGICMFDDDRRLIVCNRRYAEMYGLPEALMRPGTPLETILDHRIATGRYAGADPTEFARNRLKMVEADTRSQMLDELRDGSIYLIAHARMPGGGSVAIHEDITERKRAEAKIAHMARHDALTGLPNRLFLRDKMEEGLARVRDGDGFAVLCLDLDNFKTVNDSLGHPAGDALLQAVTRRLQVCVRETDTVARLGGDEFAILQPGPSAPERAATLARRIIEVLSAAFTIEGQQVVVGTSIGIALAPQDGAEPDLLLKNADLALYRAKDDGRRTYRFFEPEMDVHQQSRRALEIDLRQALVTGEFELFYQPIVGLSSGQIVGLEALLRWCHPERGLLSPGEFVPMCEETGLIVPLGDWVLRTACCEVARMSDDISVAVNLSPVQFKAPGIVSSVMQALSQARLDPGRLEVEITESVLLLESEDTLAALHRLRDLGVRISMDDFGTGYSSLSYLRRFPFDRIKIDRSFIADLETKDDCRAIIRAVASLGSDLGIDTTAEGVETESQLKTLRAEGLTEVQGYLFSPPVPRDEIVEVLARAKAAVSAA
ncbi:putative bifunctional diguanylate cyclase/phosphodiesterase [Microbaculum sp. FT89]|uniref:putative bifunctional diguanylate cyclase/phosphodiesterase n=1 Tax=Microbaculum sp. FT89 TaxID=3447298 RepID=UPI003F52F88A